MNQDTLKPSDATQGNIDKGTSGNPRKRPNQAATAVSNNRVNEV